MNKIRKGLSELEEMKRINKELYKIFQEQDQYFQSDHRRYSSVKNQKHIFIRK